MTIICLVGASAQAKVKVWKGEVELSGRVVVEKGDVLKIEPGTVINVKPGKDVELVVRGMVEILGDKDSPVVFKPENRGEAGTWKGIFIYESKKNIFKFTVVEGALKGVSLVSSTLDVANCRFVRNAAGVEVNQKSRLSISGSTFEENVVGIAVLLSGVSDVEGCKFTAMRDAGIVIRNGGGAVVRKCDFSNGKRGIFALTNSPVEIRGSRFTALDAGVVFSQVGKNSKIVDCKFENNARAISSIQFSYAVIEDSYVVNNKVGIDIREFSSPHVTHCEFKGNDTGISMSRKCNPLIDYNVFVNNRTALFIDYSSYPGVFKNNFERNEFHIKLGKFQSGDWEKREGSRMISRGKAAKRGSRNLRAFDKNVKYPNRVNARGNFWGTDLGELGEDGANLEKIWDGMDFGPVTYEGYGDKKYKIDLVDYSDWEKEPIREAGVRRKGNNN